jgi:prevent-host-death family protein
VVEVQITNISEAKAQFSALIEKVISGSEVIIGKAGKPVAKIVRYNQNEEPRIPGVMQGKIHIAEDFDELPEDIGTAFGMVDK